MPKYIETDNQLADVLTKSLPREKHSKLVKMIVMAGILTTKGVSAAKLSQQRIMLGSQRKEIQCLRNGLNELAAANEKLVRELVNERNRRQNVWEALEGQLKVTDLPIKEYGGQE